MDDLQGLPDIKGTLTGTWNDDAAIETVYDVSFRPMEPFTAVANRLFYGMVQPSYGVGPVMMQFWSRPITDRRVARRISRETGMKFTKHGAEYRFRGQPQKVAHG
jgi:hypothetical protein